MKRREKKRKKDGKKRKKRGKKKIERIMPDKGISLV